MMIENGYKHAWHSGDRGEGWGKHSCWMAANFCCFLKVVGSWKPEPSFWCMWRASEAEPAHSALLTSSSSLGPRREEALKHWARNAALLWCENVRVNSQMSQWNVGHQGVVHRSPGTPYRQISNFCFKYTSTSFCFLYLLLKISHLGIEY